MKKYKVEGFRPNEYEQEVEIQVVGTSLVLSLTEMHYEFGLKGIHEEREFNLISYKCIEFNDDTEEERERELTPEEKHEIECNLVEFVDWCEWLSSQELDADMYRDDF